MSVLCPYCQHELKLKGVKPGRLSAMLQSANQAATTPAKPRPPGPGLVKGTLRILFGVRTRFLTGAVLLGLCLWWTQQNVLLSNAIYHLVADFSWPSPWPETRPFSFLMFPPEAVGKVLFNSFNPGLAGLLLILSTFFQSRKVIGSFYLGALIAFLGPLVATLLGLATVDIPLWGVTKAENLSLAAGGLLAVMGLLWSALLDRDD